VDPGKKEDKAVRDKMGGGRGKGDGGKKERRGEGKRGEVSVAPSGERLGKGRCGVFAV